MVSYSMQLMESQQYGLISTEIVTFSSLGEMSCSRAISDSMTLRVCWVSRLDGRIGRVGMLEQFMT